MPELSHPLQTSHAYTTTVIYRYLVESLWTGSEIVRKELGEERAALKGGRRPNDRLALLS